MRDASALRFKTNTCRMCPAVILPADAAVQGRHGTHSSAVHTWCLNLMRDGLVSSGKKSTLDQKGWAVLGRLKIARSCREGDQTSVSLKSWQLTADVACICDGFKCIYTTERYWGSSLECGIGEKDVSLCAEQREWSDKGRRGLPPVLPARPPVRLPLSQCSSDGELTLCCTSSYSGKPFESNMRRRVSSRRVALMIIMLGGVMPGYQSWSRGVARRAVHSDDGG